MADADELARQLYDATQMEHPWGPAWEAIGPAGEVVHERFRNVAAKARELVRIEVAAELRAAAADDREIEGAFMRAAALVEARRG